MNIKDNVEIDVFEEMQKNNTTDILRVIDRDIPMWQALIEAEVKKKVRYILDYCAIPSIFVLCDDEFEIDVVLPDVFCGGKSLKGTTKSKYSLLHYDTQQNCFISENLSGPNIDFTVCFYRSIYDPYHTPNTYFEINFPDKYIIGENDWETVCYLQSNIASNLGIDKFKVGSLVDYEEQVIKVYFCETMHYSYCGIWEFPFYRKDKDHIELTRQYKPIQNMSYENIISTYCYDSYSTIWENLKSQNNNIKINTINNLSISSIQNMVILKDDL